MNHSTALMTIVHDVLLSCRISNPQQVHHSWAVVWVQCWYDSRKFKPNI